MEYAKCSEALYYDLVKIPHGHIPAPMVGFWKWLSIPVKGFRTRGTFYCPTCGDSSFFKVDYTCRGCEWWADDHTNYEHWMKRRGREKTRKRWKAFEYALLPLYILFGKAWYMRSNRYHSLDLMNGRVPPVSVRAGG